MGNLSVSVIQVDQLTLNTHWTFTLGQVFSSEDPQREHGSSQRKTSRPQQVSFYVLLFLQTLSFIGLETDNVQAPTYINEFSSLSAFFSLSYSYDLI